MATLTTDDIDNLAKALIKAQGGGSSSTPSSGGGGGGGGGNSIKNFSSSLSDAEKSAKGFTASLFDPNKSVSSFTEGITKPIPILNTFGKATAEVIGFLEESNRTFQNLSKVGAGFNGDLGALSAAAGNARMTIGAFANMVGNNAQNLTTLGGSVNQGAKRFAELSRAMFEDGDVIGGMTNLGYSLEESNELLLDNAALLGRQARLRGMSDGDVAQATLAMAKNIAVMAEISGESAKKQKEDLIDAQRDGKNIAANRRMERRGITDATETMNETLIGLGPLGSAAKAFAQDLNQTGTPMSAMTKNFKLMHPQAAANIEQMQRVRESDMSTAEKNREIARLSKEAKANFAEESVGDTQLFAASIGQLNSIGASQAKVIEETRAFVEGVEAVQKRMGDGTTIQEATQAFLTESRNLINTQAGGGAEGQEISRQLNEAAIKIANGSSKLQVQLGKQLTANETLITATGDLLGGVSGLTTSMQSFLDAVVTDFTNQGKMNETIQDRNNFGELFQAQEGNPNLPSTNANPNLSPGGNALEQGRKAKEGRAIGGGVTAGNAYKVGELGPETFLAGMDGAIIPNMKAMLNRMPDIAKTMQDSASPQQEAIRELQATAQNLSGGSVEEKLDNLNRSVLQLVNINNMQKDIGNKQIKTMRSAGNLMSGIGRA